MIIQARTNEKVKFLRRLFTDKDLRKSEGVFIAEGATLVADIPSFCYVQSFFVKESKEKDFDFLFTKFSDAEKTVLSDDVFASVSDQVSPSGIIAVVKRKEFEKPKEEVVLLLDGISDPGNMGTIIRTASARGIKTIVCIHSCCEPYSPKSVRASMGGIYYENIIEVSNTQDAFDLLRDYKIVSLDMGGISIYGYNYIGKVAIAVGNEAHGISQEVREKSFLTVALPMEKNGVESLNASVATGIAMYMIKKGE